LTNSGSSSGGSLQIDRQHHQDRIARCVAQAVEGGSEHPEVAGIHHNLDRGIGCRHATQDLDRPVRGGVVDEHMFPQIAGQVAFENLLHGPRANLDVVFLIVARRNDCDFLHDLPTHPARPTAPKAGNATHRTCRDAESRKGI